MKAKPLKYYIVKIQDIASNKRLLPYLAFSFVVVPFLGTAIFVFVNTVQSLNQTYEAQKINVVLPVQINFEALDTVALKLGIEIPVRNIPSRTSLSVNQPPTIFNFTAIRSQVLQLETITVFLNLFDAEDDELDIKWEATGGKLVPLTPQGPARWQAPTDIGIYTISVSVSDLQPQRDRIVAKFDIEVIKRPPGDIPPQEIPHIATLLVGLVKEEGNSQKFFVKSDGQKVYKRIIVNDGVIGFYTQLTLNDVQVVPQGTLDDYIFSEWIRGKDKSKVYKVNSADATKQWYDMTFEEFKALGGNDETVFTVNEGELNYYENGPDITS